MAKNFRKEYESQPELREMVRFRTPDVTTEKFSDWTYADMKREFAASVKLFSENGFEDESAELAYHAVKLSLFCGGDKETNAMTENIMALTLFLNAAAALDEVNPYLAENYGRFVSEYKSSPTHGLTLSPEEQAELDSDVESVLEKLRGFTPKPQKSSEPEWVSAREITLPFESYAEWEKNFVPVDPPADSDERMRARLSDAAYEMMTEYERSKTSSLDIYEKRFLLPHGLKMADKLREFDEIYGGRVFAWRKTWNFYMDYPWSQTSPWGYSIGLCYRMRLFEDGTYCIEAMPEHTTQDRGLHIGSDGKVYDCAMGVLYFLADSVEEFLESEARQYRMDKLLLERRRELENKYLVPKIRTASI
ncbi:MAG: hypothetical protein NC299_06100 [Lachnospiraceae bacterium]|nr:hypothetical protein [Ruminococcus sp.]MCM1274925.1 hypothetical protein [Lachnospiraceae bacterium]